MVENFFGTKRHQTILSRRSEGLFQSGPSKFPYCFFDGFEMAGSPVEILLMEEIREKPVDIRRIYPITFRALKKTSQLVAAFLPCNSSHHPILGGPTVRKSGPLGRIPGPDSQDQVQWLWPTLTEHLEMKQMTPT